MISSRARRLGALSLAAALSLGAAAAHAGPEEEQKSRQLFKQAESLANDGRWKEACHLYQAAHDLNSTGGTALRAADCYEKIADYERALEMYQYVVDHRAKDKVAERVRLAEGRVSALKKQLGKDQPTQGPAAQKPVAQSPTQTPALPTAPPPPEPPPAPVPNRVPAFVALGLGGAGAIAGAVLGGLALMQSGDIKSACGEGPTCAPKGSYGRTQFEDETAAMSAKAWGANIALGVAVVGVTTGIILYALKVPRSAPALKSAFGPRGISLRF